MNEFVCHQIMIVIIVVHKSIFIIMPAISLLNVIDNVILQNYTQATECGSIDGDYDMYVQYLWIIFKNTERENKMLKNLIKFIFLVEEIQVNLFWMKVRCLIVRNHHYLTAHACVYIVSKLKLYFDAGAACYTKANQ